MSSRLQGREGEGGRLDRAKGKVLGKASHALKVDVAVGIDILIRNNIFIKIDENINRIKASAVQAGRCSPRRR